MLGAFHCRNANIMLFLRIRADVYLNTANRTEKRGLRSSRAGQLSIDQKHIYIQVRGKDTFAT